MLSPEVLSSGSLGVARLGGRGALVSVLGSAFSLGLLQALFSRNALFVTGWLLFCVFDQVHIFFPFLDLSCLHKNFNAFYVRDCFCEFIKLLSMRFVDT